MTKTENTAELKINIRNLEFTAIRFLFKTINICKFLGLWQNSAVLLTSTNMVANKQ